MQRNASPPQCCRTWRRTPRTNPPSTLTGTLQYRCALCTVFNAIPLSLTAAALQALFKSPRVPLLVLTHPPPLSFEWIIMSPCFSISPTLTLQPSPATCIRSPLRRIVALQRSKMKELSSSLRIYDMQPADLNTAPVWGKARLKLKQKQGWSSRKIQPKLSPVFGIYD